MSDHDAFLIRSPPRTSVRFDADSTAAAHLAFQDDDLTSEMPKMWDRIRRSMALNIMKQKQQQRSFITENGNEEKTEFDESDF